MTKRVAIVGAGPVGMVCALALNRRGVPVTVLEQEPAPVEDQRAASLHPSTLEMLDDLGITEKIIPLGLISSAYRFHDRVTHSVVAEFDLGLMKDEYRFPFVLQYEQYKLTASITAEYANAGDFDVRFSHTVTGLTETADGVELEVNSPDGIEKIRADYVIGCDGGRSTVRKCLGIEFEGYTWPERFLVLTTLFDFERALGCCPRSYISDPEEWTNLFKVMGDDLKGRWRAVFPARENETDEEAFSEAAVHRRMRKLSQDHAMELLVHRNIYRVHQRVAKAFRSGRVFLAGDAAHVNNPVGGLGLNCGIHDALEIAETLRLVASGEAGEELLDRYERRRRPLNIEYVQQQTVANKKRLEEQDPRVRRANFDELRRAAEDPRLHKQFLMRTSLIESARKAARIA